MVFGFVVVVAAGGLNIFGIMNGYHAYPVQMSAMIVELLGSILFAAIAIGAASSVKAHDISEEPLVGIVEPAAE